MSPESSDVFLRMCRLCIINTDKGVNLYPLYSQYNENSSSNIVDIIERFTTIKISLTDNLPQHICYNCIKVLRAMLQFENKCKRNDVELQKIKQNLKDNDNDNEIEIKKEILDGACKRNDVELEKMKQNLEDNDNENEIEIKKEILDGADTNNDVKDSVVDIGLELKIEMEDDEINFLFCDTNTSPNSAGPNNIRQTMTSYQDSKKIACHICGKLYEPGALKYHINTHEGVKPFECQEAKCTSKFASPQALRIHKKQCHLNTEPQFFCNVCNKGFTRQTSFKRHCISHRDPELPCLVCKKLFKRAISLKKHMLVHSQERKYPCNVCKKSFQNNYTLRIHQRVHTQEKPYSYNCGANFAYKCLLKSHAEKCDKAAKSSS